MPAGTNDWALGQMYGGGLLNGNPFYTQPGGPFTAVYPTQKNAAPWPEYPIPGLFINEYTPWFSPGCGHAIQVWRLIREFDYPSQQSVCLITCEICQYVQNAVSPYEEILNPIQRAIIVG